MRYLKGELQFSHNPIEAIMFVLSTLVCTCIRHGGYVEDYSLHLLDVTVRKHKQPTSQIVYSLVLLFCNNNKENK